MFKKGNQLGKLNKGMKKDKVEAWERMGFNVSHTFTEDAIDIMADMKKTNPEKFLNYYLAILDYFKPRIQRTELTGKDGEDLNLKVDIMDVNPND